MSSLPAHHLGGPDCHAMILCTQTLPVRLPSCSLPNQLPFIPLMSTARPGAGKGSGDAFQMQPPERKLRKQAKNPAGAFQKTLKHVLQFCQHILRRLL